MRPQESPPGAKIRAIRQGKGESLRTVERKDPRLDRGRWSRIERGLRPLKVSDLYRIARVLELRDLERALRPFVEDP